MEFIKFLQIRTFLKKKHFYQTVHVKLYCLFKGKAWDQNILDSHKY